MIDTQAEYYPSLAKGRMDIVTTDVAATTGRPAHSHRDWAERALTRAA